MRRARYLLALGVLLALTCPAKAQQARAPAGGSWYGGHFYQGGQFMPNGSGMGFGFSEPSFNFSEPRTSYRRAARTKYRTSAKVDAGESVDQAGLASTRLQMAKNLMKLGKDEQARSWLLKVSEMNASPVTASEACQLLCEIEDRLSPGAPKKAFVRGQ
jgi:hypothetical protein